MGWDDRRMLYQSGNQLWHSDSSFKPVPAHSSALSARVIPPEGGRDRVREHARRVRDPPDENVRRDVDRLIVVHSFGFSRSLIDPGIGTEIGRDYPPVRHALVRANPRNGRRSLYIGSHAWYIEGMGLDESRMLIAQAARAHGAGRPRLPAPLAGGRPRDVGQPLRAAPRPPLGQRALPARHAPHHGGRRRRDRRSRLPQRARKGSGLTFRIESPES